MKEERAITMTSLIIYVIGMVIVIGTISALTTFFYKNIDIKNIGNDSTTQYTKFLSVFTEEINKTRNTVLDAKTSEENGKKISYIIFSSGNQYTFKEENNSIYKNNIKICQDIDNCEFSYTFVDSKYKIKVEFKNKDIEMIGDKSIVYSM